MRAEQLPPNSADFSAPPPSVLGNYEPREDDLCVCLCGCGKSIDNSGRSASHRRKWASAACRQRAHAERARETLGLDVGCPSARQTTRLMPVEKGLGRPPAATSQSFNTYGRHGRAVVSMGECWLATLLVGGARRDSVSGALVRAWRVKFTDPEGEDRNVEMSASEIADLVLKGAAPEADQRLAEELEAAEARSSGSRRIGEFRGVTESWYGDAARYNAAFSLLRRSVLAGRLRLASASGSRPGTRSPGAPAAATTSMWSSSTVLPHNRRTISSGYWLTGAIMFV